MSRQLFRGSADEYQADEQAGAGQRKPVLEKLAHSRSRGIAVWAQRFSYLIRKRAITRSGTASFGVDRRSPCDVTVRFTRPRSTRVATWARYRQPVHLRVANGLGIDQPDPTPPQDSFHPLNPRSARRPSHPP